MEHLWHHLKSQLKWYDTPPRGVYELWDRVSEEWNKIPTEVCQNLIKSMPKHVKEVIKANGGHTNTRYPNNRVNVGVIALHSTQSAYTLIGSSIIIQWLHFTSSFDQFIIHLTPFFYLQ